MNPTGIQSEVIVSAPFQENSYVLWRTGRADCLVVDPGFEPHKIIEILSRHGLTPAAILNTHGHADHIAGNAAMKDAFPHAPIVIGRNDREKLTDPWQNLSAPFGLELTSPPADHLVDDGGVYTAAGFDLEVIEIPGHSIGHVVFICRESPILVIGGDVLFAGSIGRTDFPDGSFEMLARGIHRNLFTLPDDTIVLPGHGPATTIGAEKRSNPFVGAPSGWREAQ